jgi:pyruvate dehydrogenase E1 component alpha subunit
MGTAIAREHAATDLATRAAAYGMVSWAVDGMDVLAVRDATERALAYVRDAGQPCFLELRTYRFRAHSMYDPDRYRTKVEIDRWKELDPIPALAARLVRDQLMTAAEVERWQAGVESEVEAEISAAIETAEAAPLEPVEDLTRFVTTVPGDATVTGRAS